MHAERRLRQDRAAGIRPGSPGDRDLPGAQSARRRLPGRRGDAVPEGRDAARARRLARDAPLAEPDGRRARAPGEAPPRQSCAAAARRTRAVRRVVADATRPSIADARCLDVGRRSGRARGGPASSRRDVWDCPRGRCLTSLAAGRGIRGCGEMRARSGSRSTQSWACSRCACALTRRACGQEALLAAGRRRAPAPRPGPAILYEPLAARAAARKRARARSGRRTPILVSGASAYRKGEFLYQGYLYDDHGAKEVLDPTNPMISPGRRRVGRRHLLRTGRHLHLPDRARATTRTPRTSSNCASSRCAKATAFRITLNTLEDPASWRPRSRSAATKASPTRSRSGPT